MGLRNIVAAATRLGVEETLTEMLQECGGFERVINLVVQQEAGN